MRGDPWLEERFPVKVLTLVGTAAVTAAIVASFLWQMLHGFCPVP